MWRPDTYRRAGDDVALLLRVGVEDVMGPIRGNLLFGSVDPVHVQFLDEIEAAMGCLVGFVVKVQQDRPATRLELATH